METVKAYYALAKPGIIRGNLMTAIAGFLFASQGDVSANLLLAIIIGVVFTIASGCVFNNYIDRFIDKKMVRTKNRELVTGKIKPSHALIYGSVLGILGIASLLAFTNVLTAGIGMLAFISYVFIYGYAKRKGPFGTVVGSLPGALSLVAGYTALTGVLDVTAIILFAIMVLWQLPHFYAIAIYRIKDYTAAELPVLSITKGIGATKKRIIMYICLYGVVSTFLYIFSYAGLTYLIVMALASVWWAWAATRPHSSNLDLWAKKVFGQSLVVLLVFSVLISINNFLP